MKLTLLTGATATNGQPQLATDGVDIRRGAIPGGGEGFGDYINQAAVSIKSTAGSGTLTLMIRLWAYTPENGWAPLGVSATGTDGDKGKLNNAVLMTNTATGSNTPLLAHSEPVSGLVGYTRLYAEVFTITGSSAAFTVTMSARG